VPDLDERGVLTKVDREKLAVLCTKIGQWEEMTQAIASTGYMVRGRDGNPVRNPLLIEQRQLARIISSLGSDFGLDPVARARLAFPNTGDPTTLDDILGGDG
jgi:P27 family predicted phage terminase small subunit